MTEHAPAIAYLTDAEGMWSKVESFCRDNPVVRLDDAGALHVAPGGLFVFGGDTVDRGPYGLRIVKALVDAKRRQPDQVVLLAGNRDINKLRLARELSGETHRRAPPEAAGWSRADMLRFLLEHTMGAKGAFEHRRAELARDGGNVTDADVVESYLTDIAPDGPLFTYLSMACLAFRAGPTLFVHGGVTEASFGVVPAAPSRGKPALSTEHLEAWLSGLEAFYQDELAAFVDGGPYDALVAYQAPVPGTRLNQASVVYGRPADDLNNPVLLPERLREALAGQGIFRVIMGHTPVGDVPCVLRDQNRTLEQVSADCSRGRHDDAPCVLVRGDVLEVHGEAILDDGERVSHRATFDARADASPLGTVLVGSGHSVRSRTEDGRYVAARLFPGFRTEQLALSPDELARRALSG